MNISLGHYNQISYPTGPATGTPVQSSQTAETAAAALSAYSEADELDEANRNIGPTVGRSYAETALANAGLPVNAANSAIVQALMDNAMPVDRDNIRQLLSQSTRFPDAGLDTLCLLNNSHIPANSANINRVHCLMDSTLLFMNSLDRVFDGIDRLASEDPEAARSLDELIRSLSDLSVNKAVPVNNGAGSNMNSGSLADGPVSPGENAVSGGAFSDRVNTDGELPSYGSAADGAVSSYDNAAEGTISSYGDAAESAVSSYGNAAESAVSSYGNAAEGTISSYGDAAEGAISSYGDAAEGIYSPEGAFADSAVLPQDRASADGTLPAEELAADGAVSADGLAADRAISADGIAADGALSADGLAADEAFSADGLAADREFSQNGTITDGIFSPDAVTADRVFSQDRTIADSYAEAIASEAAEGPDSGTEPGLPSQRLKKLLSLSPDEVSRSSVRELYERLSDFLDKARSISENNPELQSLKKPVEAAARELSFLRDLNSSFPYVELPLRLQQDTSEAGLYVFARKKNRIPDPSDCSALLHLNMPALGPLDIRLNLKDESLKLDFTSSQDSLDSLQADVSRLNDTLSGHGYKVSSTFNLAEEAPEADQSRTGSGNSSTESEHSDTLPASSAFDKSI